MVPLRRWTDKLREHVEIASRHRRVLAWGFALWVISIALPCAFMFPDGGLHRPVTWALAALAPVAMIVAAASAQPQLVFGVGLASHLPLLVACPDLLGPRVVGPIQGLAVAVLILGFAAAAFDSTPGRAERVPVVQRFARLFRWPQAPHRRLVAALAVAWAVLAWSVLEHDTAVAEPQRAVRVAAVALCWMAVVRVPLQRPAATDVSVDAVGGILVRRGVWVALAIGAWVWLQRGAS